MDNVEKKPVDCSGTPASCPDNEGHGCACSPVAAAPQVVADEHSELAYTAEEAREEFLAQVRHLVGHWERESRAPTAKEKLGGLAFSIMNIFDGTSGLPAFDIVCAPHPDDKRYHIYEGSKYFVPGMVINDCHLHEMLFDGRAALAASPVQADEFESLVAQFIDIIGVTDTGDTLADARSAINKLHKVMAAPVQPVAVPEVRLANFGVNGPAPWSAAATVAQGDAKEDRAAQRDRLNKKVLAMPDGMPDVIGPVLANTRCDACNSFNALHMTNCGYCGAAIAAKAAS